MHDMSSPLVMPGQGERMGAAALSAEEVMARQLQEEVEGVGESTAQVLALTCALGGARHASLVSLRTWARLHTNAQQLQHFLLHRWEGPQGTSHTSV